MNEHDENGVQEDMTITDGDSIEFDTEVVEDAISGQGETMESPDFIEKEESILEETTEEAEEVTQEVETVVIPASPDVVEVLPEAEIADTAQEVEQPKESGESFLFYGR